MKWNQRFMRLALEARSWVKGPDLGVGAAVVSPNKRQLSLGYSGLARGMDVTKSLLTDPSVKDNYMVHAELNAILNASCALTGWTLYSTKFPCTRCATAAIQAGITRVVAPEPDCSSRWCGNQKDSMALLQALGVEVTIYEGKV